QISSSENIEGLMICDQYGRLVLSPPSENNTIDVSALESGMYFLIISTEKGQISKKFIKE
ncbi:MAG: T9SS type A sorting domain-containing protein, partial [Bacteroidales bacterium]|nr:T9SS type A sorting domain-containing protein [Bacteroidales bacterium]